VIQANILQLNYCKRYKRATKLIVSLKK